MSREIEEVEGDLVEIEREKLRKAKRSEVGKAKTIDELWAISKERGYKSGWVYQMAKVKGIKV